MCLSDKRFRANFATPLNVHPANPESFSIVVSHLTKSFFELRCSVRTDRPGRKHAELKPAIQASPLLSAGASSSLCFFSLFFLRLLIVVSLSRNKHHETFESWAWWLNTSETAYLLRQQATLHKTSLLWTSVFSFSEWKHEPKIKNATWRLVEGTKTSTQQRAPIVFNVPVRAFIRNKKVLENHKNVKIFTTNLGCSRVFPSQLSLGCYLQILQYYQ